MTVALLHLSFDGGGNQSGPKDSRSPVKQSRRRIIIWFFNLGRIGPLILGKLLDVVMLVV